MLAEKNEFIASASDSVVKYTEDEMVRKRIQDREDFFIIQNRVQRELEEKTQQLAENAQQLAEKDQQLEKNAKQLEEKDQQISEYQKRVAELEALLNK